MIYATTVLDSLVDVYFFVKESHIRDKFHRGLGIQIFAGGGAGNFAAGLARLGKRVVCLGKLGVDPHTTFLIQELRKSGADVSRVSVTKGLFNGMNFVLMRDLTPLRHFIYGNAYLHLNSNEVDLSLVRRARILHVSGHTLYDMPASQSIISAMQYAQKNGVTVTLDPVFSYPITRRQHANIKKAIGFCDFLLPNNHELLTLTKEKRMRNAIQAIKRLGPTTVVVKMGERGCYLSNSSQRRFHAFKVSLSDANGAGDAFNAGFCYGLMSEWSLEKTCIFANAVAAMKVTTIGPRGGLPHANEVRAFLRRRYPAWTRLS